MSHSKLSLLVLVIFCLFNQTTLGQTQFQKTLGTSSNDRNYYLSPMPDGGFVATGYTEAVAGNADDAYLVKFNRFGEMEWAQTYGDIGDETSWDVLAISNTEIIGGGVSGSLGTPFNASTLTKTDGLGTVLWSTGVYGTAGNVEFYRIAQTRTGHFLATGLAGTAGGGDDIVLCKFTSTGTMLWSRVIGTAQADEAMGLIETSQGHYLMAGLSSGTGGFGSSDFAAVKTNTSGQVIWKKIYGGGSGERLNDVVEVNNSYYFIGWSSSAGQGGSDIILMNTDTAGNVNWVKSYGTAQNDRAFSILYDQNANALILGGYTDYSSPGPNNRNTLLLSVDLNGNMNWAKSYGGSGEDGHWPTGLAQNDDEGYYILGSSDTYGAGNMDLFLIKTDINGDTDCNQKDPMFTQANVNGWNGTNFGSDANIGLTAVSLTFSGSAWNPSLGSQCCQLFAEAGAGDTLCPGDTALLGSPAITGYSYSWFLGGSPISNSAELMVPYGNPGNYQLVVTAPGSGCSGQVANAIVLDDQKPALGFQSDYQFCEGDSIVLTTSAMFDSLKWFSAITNQIVQTGNTYTVHETDTLLLEIYTANECVYYDTVRTEEIAIPVFNLGADTSFCEGDSIMLHAPPGYAFNWLHDTTITSNTITVKTSGTYILQLTNQICTYTDTVHVTVIPIPVYSLGNDTAICEGDSIVLQAPTQFDHVWLHDTSITSKTITVNTSGTYILALTNQICTYTDTIEVTVNALPVFTLGNDTAFCEGNEVALNAPISWAHVWLHDTTITDKSISVNVSGIYAAKVTDANGCLYVDSIGVTVNPLPIFSLGSDTAFCHSDSMTLEAPAMYDHIWQHDTTVTNKSITVTTSGTYIAKVTDQQGCMYMDTVEVMVHSLPIFSLGSDTTFCDGDSIRLYTPTAFDHTWLHDTTITDKSVTVGASGTFAAKVIDSNGCIFTDSIRVTAHPLPVFSLGSDTAFCEGDSVILQAPAQFDHTWLHDTSITSKAITVNMSGTFVVETEAMGCTYLDTVEVTAHPLPSISLGPDVMICPGDWAIIQPVGTFDSFLWIPGPISADSLIITTDSIIIIQGISAAGCVSYDTIIVSLVSMPDSIFMADTVYFSNSTVLDAGPGWASYDWHNDSTSQMLAVDTSGWYYVTVVNAEGCLLTDSIYANKITGISRNEPNFAIYPNPVRDQLILELEKIGNQSVYLQIWSITGQRVKEIRLADQSPTHIISVAELTQGIYFLQLHIADGKLFTVRFVKE